MDRLDLLRDRAALLAQSRSFFSERNVMEVDCPMLTPAPSIDAHIDVIVAHPFDGIRYLHTSPEYCMKRLLAEGMGDIYQLSHVFRDGECGAKHNPEFTMAEWYRVGIAYEAMIEETLDYIRLFLGDLSSTHITYEQAFQKYAGVNYRDYTDDELNIILGTEIEPHLGQDGLCVLKEYPATQCALAQTIGDVAERFEVYYKGVELANGYHELADAAEQRRRFEESNVQRLALGKNALPIDEAFLGALKSGLPNCCGVAVGFDRLMMLRHQQKRLSCILPMSWN